MKKIGHMVVGATFLLAITLGYSALLRWLPDGYNQTAQDALWALPTVSTPIWWGVSAGFAGIGALTMFLYMIMNQPFSGLLVSRIILMGAMVCFALVPLNSGWLPWGVMLASIGGCYASFLIATNWCERENRWRDLWAALTFRRNKGSPHRSILG